MKTAIIYATHHGTTETVAKLIQQQLLPQQAELINLANNKQPNISTYDKIIVGSSIHAGKNQSVVQKFCSRNMPELLQKKIGLFLCCLNENEFTQSLENAYPEILRKHAVDVELLGGEYKMDKMNFIERFLIKRITGVAQSQSMINHAAIQKFSKNMI